MLSLISLITLSDLYSLQVLTFSTILLWPNLVTFAVTKVVAQIVIASNLACIYTTKRVKYISLSQKFFKLCNSLNDRGQLLA